MKWRTFLPYPTHDRGGNWQRRGEYGTNSDHRWDIHRSTDGIRTEHLRVTFKPFLMSRHTCMSLRLVFVIKFFLFVEKFFVHYVHFAWLPYWFCNFRQEMKFNRRLIRAQFPLTVTIYQSPPKCISDSRQVVERIERFARYYSPTLPF